MCAAPSLRSPRWPNGPAAASSCSATSARRRSASAIYAGGGSIAIVGAARVGLMAAFDPDDDEVDDLNERRRVLAMVKNNVGRMAPSLSYRIVEAGQASRIDWLGAVAHRADDLVDQGAPRRGPQRQRTLPPRPPRRWRRPRQGSRGERPARTAGRRNNSVPCSAGSVADAVKSGFDGPWMWTLAPPQDAQHAQDAHISNRESSESWEGDQGALEGLRERLMTESLHPHRSHQPDGKIVTAHKEHHMALATTRRHKVVDDPELDPEVAEHLPVGYSDPKSPTFVPIPLSTRSRPSMPTPKRT